MTIHERIKARRTGLKWSHERLAAEVSRLEGLKKPLSWQTVQQWENKTAPKRTRLAFVAAALGVSVGELQGLEVGATEGSGSSSAVRHVSEPPPVAQIHYQSIQAALSTLSRSVQKLTAERRIIVADLISSWVRDGCDPEYLPLIESKLEQHARSKRAGS